MEKNDAYYGSCVMKLKSREIFLFYGLCLLEREEFGSWAPASPRPLIAGVAFCDKQSEPVVLPMDLPQSHEKDESWRLSEHRGY